LWQRQPIRLELFETGADGRDAVLGQHNAWNQRSAEGSIRNGLQRFEVRRATPNFRLETFDEPFGLKKFDDRQIRRMGFGRAGMAHRRGESGDLVRVAAFGDQAEKAPPEAQSGLDRKVHAVMRQRAFLGDLRLGARSVCAFNAQRIVRGAFDEFDQYTCRIPNL
jgi:hypothetical protein